MRFLNLILILLMWTEAVFAVSTTDNNKVVGKTLKVASEYVTSMNKLDGSFESGNTGWVASVGTIPQTASTEFQGNYKGLWSATGAGTLDLQWTATASNTYEASAIVSVDGADSDHYVCAVVNGVETGCTLFDGPGYTPNKQIKVSAIADSVKGASFYLRIKHTGTDAFNLSIDDGKIQPWTPQTVQTMEQESITYTGYQSGSTSGVLLRTKESTSNNSVLLSVTQGAYTKYTTLKNSQVTLVFSENLSTTTASWNAIEHYNASGTLIKRVYGTGNTSLGSLQTSYVVNASSGDYFVPLSSVTNITDNTTTSFSITATALRNNVVQAWQAPDTIGEIKYLPQNIAPSGFIPANGITIGYTSGTYQGAVYFDLYKVLWNIATTTSTDPYYISSAKGASADADWAANKTIKIDESGLFTRAYKSGTTGAVGAKQLDAFQGHYHDIKVGYGPGSTNTGPSDGSNRSGTTYQYGFDAGVKSPITDGTNGTPRVASETRPTNVAKYAFIRYATAQPTLLALPTSKINSYTAKQNGTTGAITTTDFNWINSSAHSSTGVTTIDFTSLGLTAIPMVSATSLASGIQTSVTSISTTAAQFTSRDYNGALVDTNISITLNKQSPDATQPGVFVGNIAKNQIAYLSEVQASGTNGGSSVATTWTTRALNTTGGDSSIVSLSSNQFTLQAGEYDIEADSPFIRSSGVKLRLYNVTDSTMAIPGANNYFYATNDAGGRASLKGRITLTSAKTFSIQYYAQLAYATYGLGGSIGSDNEIYTQVKITKLNGN